VTCKGKEYHTYRVLVNQIVGAKKITEKTISNLTNYFGRN